jgi:hypothetical protein
MSGCKVDEEDETGGTKTRSERIKRVPLPTPQSQASSSPLFEQEGSAICDRFYELISESFAMSELNTHKLSKTQ